jgi:adenylate kinase family enzyme
MTDSGVLVLAGPPCSGKSAVGEALASDSMLRVQVDGLFDLLLPRSNRNSADRMLAYDAAHLLARMLLTRGFIPVLECTYSRTSQRTSLVEAILDLGSVPLWVVEMAVPPDEAVRRYRHSAVHRATDLTEQLVRERARTFPYTAQALKLQSMSAKPVDLADQIRGWLAQGPEPVDQDQWARAGKSASAP